MNHHDLAVTLYNLVTIGGDQNVHIADFAESLDMWWKVALDEISDAVVAKLEKKDAEHQRVMANDVCHCHGRLGWYSPDNGQWVGCNTCPAGKAENERIRKSRQP